MVIQNGGGKLSCCDHDMERIEPYMKEGNREYHLPEYKICKNIVKVKISTEPHPMSIQHNISFVVLQTDKGVYIKKLMIGDDPCLEFNIAKGECPISIKAYCNIHGLWETVVDCIK